jgi:hypothetical protein
MPLPFGAGNRGLDRRTGMGQPVCVRERDRMPGWTGWGGGRWGKETSAEGVLGWSGPHPGNANGVEAVSPGLDEGRGQPWVRCRNGVQPQRGCGHTPFFSANHLPFAALRLRGFSASSLSRTDSESKAAKPRRWVAARIERRREQGNCCGTTRVGRVGDVGFFASPWVLCGKPGSRSLRRVQGTSHAKPRRPRRRLGVRWPLTQRDPQPQGGDLRQPGATPRGSVVETCRSPERAAWEHLGGNNGRRSPGWFAPSGLGQFQIREPGPQGFALGCLGLLRCGEGSGQRIALLGTSGLRYR